MGRAPAGAAPGGVGELQLVVEKEAEFDHPAEQEHEEHRDEGELDQCLAL